MAWTCTEKVEGGLAMGVLQLDEPRAEIRVPWVRGFGWGVYGERGVLLTLEDIVEELNAGRAVIESNYVVLPDGRMIASYGALRLVNKALALEQPQGDKE